MHRVASLVKRWLLGTHQGAVEAAHMHSYMDEFVFRFNRRRSRSRGLVFYRVLELAVAHEPVRYQDLIATKRSSTTTHRLRTTAHTAHPQPATSEPPLAPPLTSQAPVTWIAATGLIAASRCCPERCIPSLQRPASARHHHGAAP